MPTCEGSDDPLEVEDAWREGGHREVDGEVSLGGGCSACSMTAHGLDADRNASDGTPSIMGLSLKVEDPVGGDGRFVGCQGEGNRRDEGESRRGLSAVETCAFGIVNPENLHTGCAQKTRWDVHAQGTVGSCLEMGEGDVLSRAFEGYGEGNGDGVSLGAGFNPDGETFLAVREASGEVEGQGDDGL